MSHEDSSGAEYAVVVPSLGREGLSVLLGGLAGQDGPPPVEVVVVDDRADPSDPLDVSAWTSSMPLRVVRGHGRGPAAARNLGWRLTTAPWVCFLDDDIELPPGWAAALSQDLLAARSSVGGSQARIVVPLPRHRRPTDWERSTAGLESARWATADMAYRRAALTAVDGFDERFPRAYREDADLALRATRAGWDLQRGARTVRHPVRPEDARASLRAQRGNADDALMRRLHGPGWRTKARTGRGRLPWHAVSVALLTVALVGATIAAGRRSAPRAGQVDVAGTSGFVAALGWVTLTGEFTLRRVLPGPRDHREIGRMALTSVLIPPLAVWHRARGWWTHRHSGPWPPRPGAVLFDRDGTLVHDVPDNRDPRLVQPCAGAPESLDRLRAAGVPVGVISNQGGVADGRLTAGDVTRVNAAVENRLGPFDTWQVCHHGAGDGCGCRKPRPGMVHAAATALGVPSRACVVVGDIGADVEAARAAGARGILVPTAVTRAEEVEDSPWVARDLAEAVELVMEWRDG